MQSAYRTIAPLLTFLIRCRAANFLPGPRDVVAANVMVPVGEAVALGDEALDQCRHASTFAPAFIPDNIAMNQLGIRMTITRVRPQFRDSL
jgi:hypothetical protein